MSRPGIAFQGEFGANSDEACREHFPDHEPTPCPTFEDAFEAVRSGTCALGLIPVENSIAGRVGDVHHLLPDSGLKIIGERFKPIRFQLMANPGTTLGDLRQVASHVMALGQCRKVIRELGMKPVVAADTAGAARELSQSREPSQAAIASRLAAEIYGLEVIREDIEDESHNTTRFVVLSATPQDAEPEDIPVITTFVFRVRNVPAALYKAMGGFATNGVNMTKLESYQIEGQFSATQFYADIEGHPSERNVRLAMEELEFFTSYLRVLGIYKASPHRVEIARRMEKV